MFRGASALITEKLSRERRSVRSAAREVGIAHTTLQRIIDGEPFNYETAVKLSKWLEMPVSQVVNIEGDNTTALATQIASVLRAEPKIATALSEGIERVLSGQMSQERLRELLAYMAYSLNIKE